MTSRLDLVAIRERALRARDMRLPSDEHTDAVLATLDATLALLDEVERLRAACSPGAALLAARLAAMRLTPVTPGELGAMAERVAHRLSAWALANAAGPTWDVSALPEAVAILGVVDASLRTRLGLEPAANSGESPVKEPSKRQIPMMPALAREEILAMREASRLAGDRFE